MGKIQKTIALNTIERPGNSRRFNMVKRKKTGYIIIVIKYATNFNISTHFTHSTMQANSRKFTCYAIKDIAQSTHDQCQSLTYSKIQ
jgi:hypothetical protein